MLEPHQVFLQARDQAFLRRFSFREIGPLIWLMLKLRKFYVFQTTQVSSSIIFGQRLCAKVIRMFLP